MLLHARLLRKFASFLFVLIFKTVVCYHLKVICITEANHYTIHLISTFVLNSISFYFYKKYSYYPSLNFLENGGFIIYNKLSTVTRVSTV